MSKSVDITGQRFGRLTAIERIPRPQFYSKNYMWWRCKCDCGREHIAPGQSLRSGNTRSCGCLNSENRATDITGQRFGRLVALKQVPPPEGYEQETPRKAWWLCKCDCGQETTVRGVCLRLGRTKSCGCLRRDELKGRKKCK